MRAVKASRHSKVVLWVLLGLGLVTAGFTVLLVVVMLRPFDTDRDLTDFENPEQALAFTSAHLPAPLPKDAAVEQLLYQRWTDWNFTARVRLPSPEAADRYLDRVRRDRKLNDEYCNGSEPARGARYFLPEVSACGAVERASAEIIEVQCNTR
jgi:hypothetical protein